MYLLGFCAVSPVICIILLFIMLKIAARVFHPFPTMQRIFQHYCKEEDSAGIWWKEGIIYQIYPRSFKDSKGTGNGDLQGIIQKLDYLEFLRIRAIWLTPIFSSPMVDNGYDISDFYKINPMFGTMEDFDKLLEGVHNKGMKLLLDFVPNHTSDQHEWFIESQKSQTNPKSDWYVWCNPAEDGGPPNNWLSVFGGSAWTFSNQRKQYYLHQFYKEQPDLNFYHAEVRQAMLDVLRFWFDKGVDGFRCDAVLHLLEDNKFRDEKPLSSFDKDEPCYADMDHSRTCNLEGVHQIVREWRQLADSYDEKKVLIGELWSSTDVIVRFYGSKRKPEFHLPLNFCLSGSSKLTTAKDMSKAITTYMKALPRNCWPNWFTGNHDLSRIGTRLGEEYVNAMNVLLLTLPGTPTVYYGEELGMLDVDLPKRHKKQDKFGRDPQRSPMQWQSNRGCGFTGSEISPWVPVHPNHLEINVEEEKFDSLSSLSLFKQLSRLRSTETSLRGLGFKVIDDSDVFAYIRSFSKSKVLVVINFSDQYWKGDLSKVGSAGIILFDSNGRLNDHALSLDDLFLEVGQALIVKLV